MADYDAELAPTIVAKLETRVSAIEDAVKGLSSSLARFIERADSNKPDIYKMAGVASVALVLAGAYFQLVKTNIDDRNLTTNEKIATTNVAVTSLATSVDKFGDKVDKRFDRLSDLTIPKEELNARLTALRDEQRRKVDVDVFKKTTEFRDDQVAAIRADIDRLKTNIVSRDDLDGRLDEFQNRINLLSTRLTEVAKNADGFAIIRENLAQLRDQVNDFQRKFIAVPAFPKYNNDGR